MFCARQMGANCEWNEKMEKVWKLRHKKTTKINIWWDNLNKKCVKYSENCKKLSENWYCISIQ